MQKDVKVGNFLKELSWERDVLKVGAVGKGEMIGLSNSTNSFYESLKKYGICFLPKAIEINDDAMHQFVEMCDKGEDKFEHLFTSLTKQNTPKFRSSNLPNRYVVKGDVLSDNFEEWNEINQQFKMLSKEIKLPDKGRGKADIEIDVSVLKSDAGLDEPQDMHTDEFADYKYGQAAKQFTINSVTAISKNSLLYIQPMKYALTLVLLEQGDTIMFRGDIPHAGAENLTEHNNYRLHGFWHVPGWKDSEKGGFTTKKSECTNHVYIMKWSAKDSKYKVGN